MEGGRYDGGGFKYRFPVRERLRASLREVAWLGMHVMCICHAREILYSDP